MARKPRSGRAGAKLPQRKGKGHGTLDVSLERRSRGATVKHVARTDHVWVEDLPEHPVRLTLRGGVTKNVGDYNSIRVDVGIEMPCSPEKVEQCYTECSTWLEEKIEDQVRMATED